MIELAKSIKRKLCVYLSSPSWESHHGKSRPEQEAEKVFQSRIQTLNITLTIARVSQRLCKDANVKLQKPQVRVKNLFFTLCCVIKLHSLLCCSKVAYFPLLQDIFKVFFWISLFWLLLSKETSPVQCGGLWLSISFPDLKYWKVGSSYSFWTLTCTGCSRFVWVNQLRRLLKTCTYLGTLMLTFCKTSKRCKTQSLAWKISWSCCRRLGSTHEPHKAWFFNIVYNEGLII